MAAAVAGVSFAVYPPALLLPCLLLKPNLFLPLFGWFLWLLLGKDSRPRRWVGIGVLGGLGALLRGNLLILLPVFALWPFLASWSSSRRLSSGLPRTAAFVGGVALVLLPVLLRNWVVGDQFALTTSGAGTNVYGGNNAQNPYGVATEFDWVRGIPRYEAGDWQREAERRLGHELDAAQSSNYWLGQVVESMEEDPVLHLGIFWNKLRLALGNYEVADNHFLEWDSRYVSLLRAPWPGFGLLGGLALAGLLLTIARRTWKAAPGRLALVFVLYLGTIVVTVMSMRARLPLVVVLFPFTGFWVAELIDALRPNAARRRSLAAVLATGLLGVGFAFWPVFDGEHRERDLAERDYNLVVQWLESEQELENAFDLASLLASTHPNSSRLQILLAETEWRRGALAIEDGDRRVGEELVRLALKRLQPITEAPGVNRKERSRAYRCAAYIQGSLGNWSPAERFFRQAREFASEDLELILSHAQSLLELSVRTNPRSDSQRAEALELLNLILERKPQSPAGLAARALVLEFE
ncbi:MAG: hypothetical protein ACI9F9_000665 [Candidatus Paceibacteria bacterium]